jgi:hypothetical protein
MSRARMEEVRNSCIFVGKPEDHLRLMNRLEDKLESDLEYRCWRAWTGYIWLRTPASSFAPVRVKTNFH